MREGGGGGLLLLILLGLVFLFFLFLLVTYIHLTYLEETEKVKIQSKHNLPSQSITTCPGMRLTVLMQNTIYRSMGIFMHVNMH